MIDSRAIAELVTRPPEEILDWTIRDFLDETDDIHFYLPYQWANTYGEGFESSDGVGNPCPEDPLTIYLTADITGCDERITFKTTFGAVLDDIFNLHELWQEPENVIGQDSVPLFEAIRDALQKEIDKINTWIETAKPEESK